MKIRFLSESNLLFVIVAILACAYQPSAAAQSDAGKPRPLTKLKPLCLNTPVVQEGKPLATLVVPKGNAELRAIAEKIRRIVRERTGAELPILEADDSMDFRSSPGTHLIALGCFADNPLLRTLYYQFYTLVDRWYPGKDGFALHTAHDPWGTGKNVIVVGGSTPTGVSDAADELLKQPPQGKSWPLPRLYKVRLSPRLKELVRQRRPPAGPKPRRDWPQLPVDWRYNLGYGIGGGDLVAAAIEYLWTGDIEAAQAYKKAMLKLGSRGSHLFYLAIPVLWDLMEEAPVFSDEERLRITNGILTYLRGSDGTQERVYRRVLPIRASRQNHRTRLAVAIYFGARYFWKYYRLPEARKWLTDVERFWAPQMGSSKPMEDSNDHQWVASLEDAATYALASGRLEFFTAGHVRDAVERHLVVARTRGGMSSLGDSNAGRVAPGLLTKAAHYYKDGRYLYPMFATRQPLRDDEICRPFADDVKPVVPKDHVGLRWAPLDRLYYDSILHKANVPVEQCFDKLAFRGGWDYKDEYLLLDGVSGGSHSYDDANNIVEVCANDRTFIATYDKLTGSNYADHNVVTVVRAGVGTNAPRAARLNLAVDLGSYAASDTEALDYAGVDARRVILWRKGRWWLVLDELQAKKQGSFSFRCRWRLLGQASLAADGLHIAQAGGQRFHVLSATPSQQSLRRDDEMLARYTSAYEHAEPGLNLYKQSVVREMKTGTHHSFINLLYADTDADQRKFSIERVGEAAVRITDGKSEERDLVALGNEKERRLGSLAWRGRLLYLSASKVVLAGGTGLSIAGQTLFHSDRPISLEIDLKSGAGMAVATDDTVFNFAGTSHRIAVDQSELRVPTAKGLVAKLRDAVKTVKALPRPIDAAHSVKQLAPLWKVNVGGAVLALAAGDVDGDGRADVALGSKAGTVGVVSGHGQLLWSRKARGRVGTVDVFDLDGDGALEIVTGNDTDKLCSYDPVHRKKRVVGYDYLGSELAKTDESRISAFAKDGKLLWETAIDYGHPIWRWWTLHSSNVRKVLADDLDGDCKGEVYAGCGNMRLYRISHKGKIVWNFRVDHGVMTRIIAADVDGDGRREVVGGCYPLSASSRCWAITPDGKYKTGFYNEGWTSALASIRVGDVAGDGKPDVLNGTNKGNLYFRSLPSRSPRWVRKFGETVTAIDLVPAASGKGHDIVVASASGYVVRLDAAGNRLWATGLPDDVLCMVAQGRGDAARLVCGCEDGGVYVLSLAGKVIGRLQTGARVRCVVALDAKRAVAGSDDGFLYALDGSREDQ